MVNRSRFIRQHCSKHRNSASQSANTSVSSAGRFISEDPFGFVGGSNRYTYVRNYLVSLTDPTGKNPVLQESRKKAIAAAIADSL